MFYIIRSFTLLLLVLYYYSFLTRFLMRDFFGFFWRKITSIDLQRRPLYLTDMKLGKTLQKRLVLFVVGTIVRSHLFGYTKTSQSQ